MLIGTSESWSEAGDLLPHTVFFHNKIIGFQIANVAAVVVEHGNNDLRQFLISVSFWEPAPTEAPVTARENPGLLR